MITICNIRFIGEVSATLKQNKLKKVNPSTYKELAKLIGMSEQSIKMFMRNGESDKVAMLLSQALKIER